MKGEPVDGPQHEANFAASKHDRVRTDGAEKWMLSHCRDGESLYGWGSNSQVHPLGPPGYGRRHADTHTWNKVGTLSEPAGRQRPVV